MPAGSLQAGSRRLGWNRTLFCFFDPPIKIQIPSREHVTVLACAISLPINEGVLESWSLSPRHTQWEERMPKRKSCAFIYLFLPQCMICGILVRWPRMEPIPPALEVQSHNHRTTRQVCKWCTFEKRGLKLGSQKQEIATTHTDQATFWLCYFSHWGRACSREYSPLFILTLSLGQQGDQTSQS